MYQWRLLKLRGGLDGVTGACYLDWTRIVAWYSPPTRLNCSLATLRVELSSFPSFIGVMFYLVDDEKVLTTRFTI